MPSYSTQARSKDEVLANFDMHNTPYISLWQAQPHNLVFVIRDGDLEEAKKLLALNIDMLIRGHSWAQYVVKYHDEDDVKRSKITNNTPYMGSIVFKLDECMPEEYKINNSGVGSAQSYELAQLRQQVQDLADQEEDEEPIVKIVRNIGNVIDDSPVLTNLAMGFLNKFFGNKATPAANVERETQMAGVNGTGESATPGNWFYNLDEPTQDKIIAAVDVLLSVDKDFPETITKLAELAKNNTSKYNLAKSML